jgi:hypothetical protein
MICSSPFPIKPALRRYMLRGGQHMNKDINRFQANTLADILLFMVVATGLFAMVVHWPVARECKRTIVRDHRQVNQSFPSDFIMHGGNIVHSYVNQ